MISMYKALIIVSNKFVLLYFYSVVKQLAVVGRSVSAPADVNQLII